MSNDTNAIVLRAQVMAAAIMSSIPLYAVVGVLVVKVGKMESMGIGSDVLTIMGAVFLVIAVGIFGASFPLRTLLTARLTPNAASWQEKTKITLIMMAFCETSAVLGLVHLLLSQRLDWAIALWVCSFANCLAHFPRRAWLLQGLEQ